MADLLHARVLEKRRDRADRRPGLEIGHLVERAVPQRRVAGVALAPGERDAHQPGPHRAGVVADDAKADAAGGSGLVHRLCQAVDRLDDGVVGGGGGSGPGSGRSVTGSSMTGGGCCARRRREVAGEGAEAQLREQGVAGRPVGAGVVERVERAIDRHVSANRDQHPARPGGIRVGEQRLAVALLLDAGRALEQRVERAELRDEVARALVADAGHALDVVDRVADEREHVDHLLRRHAELLDDAGRVVPGAFVAGVEHANPPADELEKVLVARDDGHVVALGRRLQRQRPDDIVRLEPLGCQHRHAEGGAGLVDERHLLDQVGRHRRPVGFVVFGEVVAERAAGQVEGGRDGVGLVVGQQLAQHRDETVDGVGRAPVGAGQAADRVVRPVHLRRAVDQEEGGHGSHSGFGTRGSGLGREHGSRRVSSPHAFRYY